MLQKEMTINQLIHIKNSVEKEEPLIHCLTNHITINDCANMILAAGGKPIMAEHCQEVTDITRSAKALAINLGNITDERMEAMNLSGEVAYEEGIPSMIDLVGVGCSALRLHFAQDFISKYRPSVIKGNMSEIKAFAGLDIKAKGVDVNDEDTITKDTLSESMHIIKNLAKETRAVVVATGVIDIISDGRRCYLIENGCKDLSKVTGTGCMLGVIIATFISSKCIMDAAALGTVMMGISGELAQDARGLGSFKVGLFDYMSTLDAKIIKEKIKIKVVE